jgi:hypothetical protein
VRQEGCSGRQQEGKGELLKAAGGRGLNAGSRQQSWATINTQQAKFIAGGVWRKLGGHDWCSAHFKGQEAVGTRDEDAVRAAGQQQNGSKG